MKLSKRQFTLGAASTGLVAGSTVFAQEVYPSHPVTIVVPFGAGGTTDLLGRILADRLGQRMKGNFIVENKAGAGGAIGVASLAKSPADGYTLGMGTVSTHAINPNINKNLTYDHVKDFVPLSLVASVPNILMCNPKLPVKTVPELIALLKKEPGKYFYASSGVGTSIHLAGELFKIMAGVDMVHVPYRSSGQITQGLLSGEIAVSFDNITIAWPQIEAGNIRALATATSERLAIAKDLPTVAETLPGFAAPAWHGLFAPAAMSPALAERLSKEVQEIMREPAVVEQLGKLGVTPVGSTIAQFAAYIAEETKRWAEVATKAQVKID